MTEFQAEPLLINYEEISPPEKKTLCSQSVIRTILIVIASVIGIAVGIGIGYFVFRTPKKELKAASQLASPKIANKTIFNDLPECEIYDSPVCPGSYDSPGDMDPIWASHRWNTPPRNSAEWRPSFQDMNTLVGYAQQRYSADRKSCTVNIYTQSAKTLSLKYEFDGVAQETPSKSFDSSYTKVLKVKVVAATGESLELPDIDFIWNVEPLTKREGDFRNGQKGAIVEMFGWPDDDIAKECKHIAEAGYLGVKLFPHQEQVMSVQPMNDELNPWYFMYQPVSYKLDGRMGTRNQLRNMIKKCRSYGLRVYADAVVNHMSGGGNDAQWHRNPSASCTYWPPKNSSAWESMSPYYTHSYTYRTNARGEPNNVLEYPAVPYSIMDFHCEKACNSWACPMNLNTGWLVGLADLDTSKDYVRTRIADYFVDLLSIGFSGFRVDAAKHIHPIDLAAIFSKFKDFMGGSLPEDFFTWLEVLTGGESPLLVGDSDYSFTTFFKKEMEKVGLTEEEIEKIKIWWSGYPTEPDNDGGRITRTRKVIQNDDHDQQNEGSSSRDMHDKGCVLVKGGECTPEKHRSFEVKLFEDPYGAVDNDNDYPIRMILSSYYFTKRTTDPRFIQVVPDNYSDCSLYCKVECSSCLGREYIPAYVEDAVAYKGTAYTHVHRDEEIIKAMKKWMHIQ